MNDSAITCDEITESYNEDAKARSHDEPNFNEKKQPAKRKTFIFTCIFINYYSIVDSC